MLALLIVPAIWYGGASGRDQHKPPPASGDGFHLSIAAIPHTVILNGPVKIKIANSGSQPDFADLELDELVTIAVGKRKAQIWQPCDLSFFPIVRGVVRVPTLAPHHSTTVIWRPLESRSYAVKPGRSYRIMVSGKAAGLGGGPVSYSNTFRFAVRRQHRDPWHAPTKPPPRFAVTQKRLNIFRVREHRLVLNYATGPRILTVL